MNHTTCDACGKEIVGDGLRIALQLVTGWNPNGDVRRCALCMGCGSQALRLLGFCYDTGMILSVARKEQVDGADVHGPNGGGLGDIAINGVGGVHNARWHANAESALPMGRMVREEAPWMRAQDYGVVFTAKYAKELTDKATRKMIADGRTDAEIGAYLWGEPHSARQARSQIERAASERLRLAEVPR